MCADPIGVCVHPGGEERPREAAATVCPSLTPAPVGGVTSVLTPLRVLAISHL